MDHLDDNMRRIFDATKEPEMKMPEDRKNATLAKLKQDEKPEPREVTPYTVPRWHRFSPFIAMAAGLAIMALATSNLSAFTWFWEDPVEVIKENPSGVIIGGSLLTYIALALSSTGPLATRAFLPLAIVCTFAAYPDYAYDVINYKINVPTALAFLTSEPALVTLWSLAVLECMAEKSNEIKEFLDEIQKGLKASVAIVITLMLAPEDPDLVNLAGAPADMVMQAGFSPGLVLAITCGGLTYFLADVRTRFFRWTREADADDALWLRGFLSWMEDIFALLGPAMIIFLPALALLFAGFLLIVTGIINWLLNRFERRGSYPCPACENAVMPAALECGCCGEELAPQRILSWNRLARENMAGNEVEGEERHQHRLRLLSQRKCPSCSEPLKVRQFLAEGCDCCGERFALETQESWFDDYLKNVLTRSVRWLPLVTLAGLIPIVGFSVSIVVIKLVLVAPLLIFLNVRQKIGLRWGMRLFTVLMLLPGCFPVVSILAAPILLGVHIWVYGRFACSRATALLEPASA